MRIETKLLSNREIKDMGYISPCWLWTGGLNKGYGKVRDDNNKTIGVHIVSARLWLKDYTPTLFVLHKCDIRSCFNPEHLFQGTIKDNMEDCVNKKRYYNQKKTHCKRGHEFTTENTYIRPNGNRNCRECWKTYNLIR